MNKLISLSSNGPKGFVPELSGTDVLEDDRLGIFCDHLDDGLTFLSAYTNPAILVSYGPKYYQKSFSKNRWHIQIPEVIADNAFDMINGALELMVDKPSDQEKIFKSFFETIPVNMYFKDKKSRFTRVNKSFLDSFGMKDEQEALGLTDFDLFGPEHAEQAFEDEQKIMRVSLAKIGYDEKETQKDGSITWANSTKIPVLDDSGEVQGLIGISYDITDKKRAEQELRESEGRLKLATEAAKLGSFDWHMEDGTLIWDYQMHALFELDPRSDIDRNVHFSNMLHPEDKLRVAKQFNRAIDPANHNVIFESEFRIIAKNKQIRHIESRALHIRDYEGNVTRIIGTCRDFSERKEFEDQLTAANEALALSNKKLEKALEKARKSTELEKANKKLEETLNQLKDTQAQLIHSEKLASVGVLAAGIAHEINNPLNFIHGGKTAIDKFVKAKIPQYVTELRPLLDVIDTGVNRSSQIVRSLNHFNRRSDSKNEKCDIHLIIENCLVMLNNKLKRKIEVKKRFTKSKFVLKGNEGELHQVILNMLTNSVQAIENTGQINLSTTLKSKQIHLTITDTGCGISKENLQKISVPFFTTKNPGEGTGLGISIAESIMDKHHGKLKFTSKPGKGTTVRISLPVQVPQMN